MRDFTGNLIARHEGVGEFVQPRTRQKFEPEPTAGLDVSFRSLPVQNTSRFNEAPSTPLTPSNHRVNDNWNQQDRKPSFVIPAEHTTDTYDLTLPATSRQSDRTERLNAFIKERYRTVDHRQTGSPHEPGPASTGSRSKVPGHADSTVSFFEAELPGRYPERSTGITERSNDGHPVKTENSAADSHSGFQDKLYQLAWLLEQSLPEKKKTYIQKGAEPQIITVFRPSEIDTGRKQPTEHQNVTLSPQKKASVPKGLHEHADYLNDYKRVLSNTNNGKEKERQTEPVINITIGRIEVRAIPRISERNDKQAKPSVVMSLDEYLKKRG